MKERDTAQIVSQAIRFVKSNPCCICSCESFCDVKYKSTCKVWRELKSKLLVVNEE